MVFPWYNRRVSRLARWVCVLSILVGNLSLFAGGSGLSVIVVVNAGSTNSLQLANYYCEKRHVPPQNVLRINWTGVNTEWTLTDCENYLVNPLHDVLTARGLTNQISYVVLSMDIPYRINGSGNGYNGTSSMLFYGFKPDSRSLGTCPLATNSAATYVGSESIFRDSFPYVAGSNAFLTTFITHSNLTWAEQIVDSGVLSDGTFPTQDVVLTKTSDNVRNVRYPLFDNAIFDVRVLGNSSMRRTNTDNLTNLGESLGFEHGLASYNVSPTTFVPGAMADTLTSFAGMIFEGSGQTPLLTVLTSGAAGSYGTVVEPCNYLSKFPNPENHFYQARGFSLAECYYQSITNPYEGIIVGEPLAAPFAVPCSGAWSNLTTGSVLGGNTNLAVQFIAADATRPVQQVDLFVDGTYFNTLTNIAPVSGNRVSVTLNGSTVNYNVGTGATIASVTAGVAAKLNQTSYSNITKVAAVAVGDRIELNSFNLNASGSQVTLSATSTINTGSALTTFVRASGGNFLDTIATGTRRYQVAGTLAAGDWLRLVVTKTNGTAYTIAVTNTLSSGYVGYIVQQLVDAVNATAGLLGEDGLVAQDLYYGTPSYARFDLAARSAGWRAAQIQVALTGSFTLAPSGTVKVDEILTDLQPRAHLYLTAGATNLFCPFELDTAALPDGWHELTAVAYEGSHVRTEGLVTETVLIQNTSLSATLETLVGDTNTALEATLQFAVTANTNNIDTIELFSTGGSWGVMSNQSSAVFSIVATNLHIGRHPFYALVTDTLGHQYRTETKWIRIIGAEPPISIGVLPEPPTLYWPATAGRLYQIWSATNVADPLVLRDTYAPTSSLGLWPEPAPAPSQQYYRVVAP